SMTSASDSPVLTTLDYLPNGLLERTAQEIHQLLPGPTLIHLPGRRQPPLFVSVLLHGNEVTGWQAIRRLLSHYARRELPRSLSLFIGNVQAASQGQRRLDGQPDYNRIWGPGATPEHAIAQAVIEQMQQRGTFASIDIHNNTGTNPHYACVNHLDAPSLHLASLFGRTVLYFTRPEGVQSMAFGRFCPAVTLECGKPDHPHGTQHAYEFLEACLHLSGIPQRPVLSQDIDLFHSVAIVKIPDQVSFSFGDPETLLSKGGSQTHICFPPDLDHLNFQEIPPHTRIGWTNNGFQLDVQDEQGRDVAARFFYTQDGEIRTAVPLMPGMLTLNSRIIRQDCLCYLMERYPLAS
ncbi:MAG: M14 family metallopeptidase, partial [Thermostichus sp. DG02_4_bins_136]